MLSIGEDNLQFYPNFRHWGGMNLDHDIVHSSVARGAGGYSLPDWHVDQKAEWEKHYVFSILKLMHWSGLNSDLKHFLRHIFKGGGD